MILRILLLSLLVFAVARFVHRLVLNTFHLTRRNQPKSSRWRPQKGIDRNDVHDAEFKDVDE